VAALLYGAALVSTRYLAHAAAAELGLGLELGELTMGGTLRLSRLLRAYGRSWKQADCRHELVRTQAIAYVPSVA